MRSCNHSPCFSVFLHATFFVFAAFVFASLSFSSSAYAARQGELREQDAFELILEVRRRDEILSRSILGYQIGFDGYFLPIGDLGRMVGFDVDVNLFTGRAEGWFLSPENTYEIDVKNGYYAVRGERFPLTAQDYFVKNASVGFGDIYIRMEMLNQIWPLELNVDFATLKLVVETAEKLPYELKKEREEKRARLLAAMGEEEDLAGYRSVENPYRMLSPPLVDLDNHMTWDSEKKEWDASVQVSGKNDLLGFSADYGANFARNEGSFNAPDRVRMTLNRKAFGDDSMPLGVRDLSVGDVSARTAEWIRGSNAGRGISVSTAPVKRKQNFDEITVEGTAFPGWEVEVYRNNDLVDFGVVPGDGVYRFDDVVLMAGNNKIRTVLYGPQGQVEERVKEYNINGSFLQPGDTVYEASLVDTSDTLISFNNQKSSGSGARSKGMAYSANVRHGLNRNMTVFATASNAMIRTGPQKFVTAGGHASFGPLSGKVEAYKALGGGYALDSRFSTRMMGWNLNLSGAHFSGFESDRAGYGATAKTRDIKVRASKRLNTPLGGGNLNISASHLKRENGSVQTNLSSSQNISKDQRRVGHNIRASWRDHELNLVEGRLNGGFRLGRKVNVRGMLNYRLKPDFVWEDVSTNMRYRHSKNLTSGVSVGRNLQDGKVRSSANVDYDFGTFLAGLQGNWQKGGGYNVGLRASTSLAPFDEDGGYLARSHSMKKQNAVRSHLFWDKGVDGVYQEEEDETLAGARMILNGHRSDETDEKGRTSIVQYEVGDYAGMEVDKHSLDNPFLVSTEEGYRVLLRPGVALDVNVPLVHTGAIDGSVYFENGDPVSGLRLQLVDKNEKVVSDTLSAFDGFYTFDLVKPGDYRIQADPEMNVRMVAKNVTISPDELFVYGADMDLLEKEEVKNARRFAALPESVKQGRYGSILGALKQVRQTLQSAVN